MTVQNALEEMKERAFAPAFQKYLFDTYTANAAAAAVDSMKLEKVVATLAGDDTIFVLCHSDSEAREFTLHPKMHSNL